MGGNSSTRGNREWRERQAARQRKLDDCLTWMAAEEFDGPEDLMRAAKQLWAVYCDSDFRHRYSNFVDIIEGHDESSADNLKAKERLDLLLSSEQARATCLTSNLRQILTYDLDKPYPGITDDGVIRELQASKGFEKLYDHVSLEAKRAGYSGERVSIVLGELNKAQVALNEAQTEIAEANSKVSQATKAANKANKKARSLQRETIAILGVFSAITLAFNASVSFTTSAISTTNTAGTNVYQIAFVVAIVGAFLFNVLYATFSFVHNLVEDESDSKKFPFMNGKQLFAIELFLAVLIVLLALLASGRLPFCH